MRILQIIQYFSPKRGGSVYSVYNLVKHLTKRGHEVVIYTTENECDYDFAASLCPAKIVTFPSYGGLLRFSPKMKRVLEDEIKQFDIMHLNNYWSYQNIIAAKSAMRHRIPYVLSPHGSLPIMMRGYLRKRLFNLFFGNNILKNAAKVIAVSNMEYHQILIRQICAEKIKVIPNAVDLSDDSPSKKGDFRRKYNIGKDEKLILFLGRIHPIKGVDLLVQSFAELAKKRNEVKLVLAGPDEGYLDTVKEQIVANNLGDKVICTGPLYDEEKYAAFFDADIYVLPSRYEIFAISILEACASGTPVIITENQGIVNFIRGKTGEVVPFQCESLMQAMEKLLADDALRLKYGQNARKMIEDIFAWEKVINQYEQVYREVIR